MQRCCTLHGRSPNDCGECGSDCNSANTPKLRFEFPFTKELFNCLLFYLYAFILVGMNPQLQRRSPVFNPVFKYRFTDTSILLVSTHTRIHNIPYMRIKLIRFSSSCSVILSFIKPGSLRASISEFADPHYINCSSSALNGTHQKHYVFLHIRW